MNLHTVIFIAVICLVLSVIGVTLFIAFSGSLGVRERIRRRLATRMKELPFYRLLRRRNINIGRHIAETPIADLEKEVKNCEACASVKECEKVLSQPEDAKVDYSFCPNDPVIRKTEKKTIKH